MPTPTTDQGNSDDTKGGLCSKCGVWKGGEYGINAAGEKSKHVCTTDQKKCVRCGLPQEDWKGRWEKPLCKVGPTTYETHVSRHQGEKEEWAKERQNLKDMLDKFPNTALDIIDAAYLAGLDVSKDTLSSHQKAWKEEVIGEIKSLNLQEYTTAGIVRKVLALLTRP